MLKKAIFKTYSFFSTLFENLFLKKNLNSQEQSNITNVGYDILPLNQITNLDFENNNFIAINPYLKKIELNSDQINSIIKKIFIDGGIANYLNQITGFNYCISHATAYQTSHIPLKMQDQPFYANHWHKDGPYSKNTLKVILPLSDIEKGDGGMLICNKNYSSKLPFFFKDSISLNNIFEFQSKKYEHIFIFNPHLCLHKAGNPTENHIRQQLVFQINPSNNWSIDKNLVKTQLMREPKFPLLNPSLMKSIRL